MDETQKRIDALLERVRKTLPMDPWTLGRVRGPLQELISRHKRTCDDGCTQDLEELLEEWSSEADQVSEQMERELHAGHAADDHEADDDEDDFDMGGES